MKDTYGCEYVKVVNVLEECDDWYGRADFILTDADIKALKQGKIINASVNREYAITIRLEQK